MLKPKPERLGPEGGVETRKLRRNCFKKFFFTCTNNGMEKLVTCKRFEDAASRAMTKFIAKLATVHCTDDDVSFMTAPECLFVKPQSRALTAGELPC